MNLVMLTGGILVKTFPLNLVEVTLKKRQIQPPFYVIFFGYSYSANYQIVKILITRELLQNHSKQRH